MNGSTTFAACAAASPPSLEAVVLPPVSAVVSPPVLELELELELPPPHAARPIANKAIASMAKLAFPRLCRDISLRPFPGRVGPGFPLTRHVTAATRPSSVALSLVKGLQ